MVEPMTSSQGPHPYYVLCTRLLRHLTYPAITGLNASSLYTLAVMGRGRPKCDPDNLCSKVYLERVYD